MCILKSRPQDLLKKLYLYKTQINTTANFPLIRLRHLWAEALTQGRFSWEHREIQSFPHRIYLPLKKRSVSIMRLEAIATFTFNLPCHNKLRNNVMIRSGIIQNSAFTVDCNIPFPYHL